MAGREAHLQRYVEANASKPAFVFLFVVAVVVGLCLWLWLFLCVCVLCFVLRVSCLRLCLSLCGGHPLLASWWSIPGQKFPAAASRAENTICVTNASPLFSATGLVSADTAIYLASNFFAVVLIDLVPGHTII